jgi:hypothetical protein
VLPEAWVAPPPFPCNAHASMDMGGIHSIRSTDTHIRLRRVFIFSLRISLIESALDSQDCKGVESFMRHQPGPG